MRGERAVCDSIFSGQLDSIASRFAGDHGSHQRERGTVIDPDRNHFPDQPRISLEYANSIAVGAAG